MSAPFGTRSGIRWTSWPSPLTPLVSLVLRKSSAVRGVGSGWFLKQSPAFPEYWLGPVVCVSRPPGAARCWLAGPLGPTPLPLKNLPATHDPQKKWEMRRSLSGGGRPHLLPAASCAPGPNAHSQPQQGAREMYGDVIFFSNTDQRLYSFTINGLPPGKGGTPRTC